MLTAEVMPDFPRDPLISRHPAPLTAAEARAEVRQAVRLRRRVPLAHPYGLLPVWVPYALARPAGPMLAGLLAPPPRKRLSARRTG